MYRRPKFLEILLDIRQEMAREADYDTDLFAEMVRTGARPNTPEGDPTTPGPKAAKAKAKRPARKK